MPAEAGTERGVGRRVREVMLVLALAVVWAAAGCSGGEADTSGDASDGAGVRVDGEKTSGSAGAPVEDELGHQAYQGATRLVVPAAEGSSLDRVARVSAGLAEDELGASVFVQRRPGDGGGVAWRDVAGEEPDGHQLAYVTEAFVASGGPGLGVGLADFEMVAQTDSGSALLVVRRDLEAESFQEYGIEDLDEFVEAAREDPGLVEVADPGAGTVYRAGTLALEREAGVDLSPKVPGKPSTEAIFDGEVEAAVVPADEVLTDVLAEELRAIAVLGGGRCPDLPDVPTAKELGYDVSVPVWGGVAAPGGTPPRVVAELGRAFEAASSSRTFAGALAGTGRVPKQRGPEEFAGFVEGQSRLLSGAGPKSADAE